MARLEGVKNKKVNFNNFSLNISKILSFQHVIHIQSFMVILCIILGEYYLFLESGAIFYNYSTAQCGLANHISRVHESHVVGGLCIITACGQYSFSREKTFIYHSRVKKIGNK